MSPMRAWRIRAYGGPEVMALEETAVPRPGPGQLLVGVRAASVNPIDWKMRRGLLAATFPLAFPRTLGRDCAGEVVSLGEGVTGFEPGAMVAGVADPHTDGTHAQFALLPAAQAAPVPNGLDAAAATSLCVAGLSAYIALVEVAQVGAGQRVLVHAGAGGVGSLAIQIGKHLGAEVLVTASAANREYCLGLGAARVIDYLREDFVAAAAPCDVVLDTLGGEIHLRSQHVLRSGGLLVALNAAPIPAGSRRADVRVVMAQVQPTRARLDRIFQWAAAGVLRPQVGRTFTFEDAPPAYAASEAGHARGKLVIAVP
jgi:NADPH:quinone reductase-like Zn-dependent oxidoreductase